MFAIIQVARKQVVTHDSLRLDIGNGEYDDITTAVRRTFGNHQRISVEAGLNFQCDTGETVSVLDYVV